MNRVSLCLLTWNELKGCEFDLPHIPLVFDRIFAIDNNSNDGTVEYLRSLGIEVITQKSKSYNGAYLDAIEANSGDSLVFFHPKGTVEVSSLETAATLMRSGVDFLLASRNVDQAQNEEDSELLKPRKWFVLLMAWISKTKWGLRKNYFLDDPLHGYRGLSSKFVSNLKLEQVGVTADIEMIKHAYSQDFKVEIMPVRESPRISGKTHFPALSTGKQILKYVLLS